MLIESFEEFNIDRFALPEALALLAIVPIFIYWFQFYFVPRRLEIHLSYDPGKLSKPSLNLSFLRFLPRFFQLLGLVSLILALARPQQARETLLRVSEGIDIMLLLDVSGSMEAEDFPPNRLEAACRTASAFIDGRQDDRIGLILFAQDALTYAPLTQDYALLKEMIGQIHFDMINKEGTALGPALAVGINRMRDGEIPAKVMIVLTDGANNRGQMAPLTAARLAQRFGIRIYCIGIGSTPDEMSPEGSAVPVVGLDETTLEGLAAITGGKFFRAEAEAGLQEIFDEISQLEKAEIREDVYREVKDLYPFFLQMGIILWGLAFLSMLSFMYNPLEH